MARCERKEVNVEVVWNKRDGFLSSPLPCKQQKVEYGWLKSGVKAARIRKNLSRKVCHQGLVYPLWN